MIIETPIKIEKRLLIKREDLTRIRLDDGNSFSLISVGNTKTGPSFSLQNILTCPGATELCKAMCYVNAGPMAYTISRNTRDWRTNWIRKNIKLFIVLMVKELKRLYQLGILFTLRIHDSGDFYSAEYVKAWYIICSKVPEIKFWFYTRSFVIDKINKELRKLAALDNVAAWISADNENHIAARLELMACDSWKGIAYMQTADTRDELEYLKNNIKWNKLVIFPAHAGSKLRKGTKPIKGPNCPEVMEKYTKTKILKESTNPACLVCKKCLP